MGSTLTTRIPDDLAEAIERISEEEQLDKSAVARRLLADAVSNRQRRVAFERYGRGDISLGTLTEEADLPLRRVLRELRRREISFQYSLESVAEDASDA